MAKNEITGWRMLWDNLDAGPRGALIAFLLIVAYFVVPIVVRLLAIIITILIITLLGAVIGSAVGWAHRKYKKRNKRKK
ncbi:hypothetical protein ACFLZZ_01775 [Nanoarchaeota archaeon]